MNYLLIQQKKLNVLAYKLCLKTALKLYILNKSISHIASNHNFNKYSRRELLKLTEKSILKKTSNRGKIILTNFRQEDEQ